MKLVESLKIYFFRHKEPSNHPITLTHRRIFILPTQSGLGFIVLIGLLFSVAFIYNNNLVYMLSFLLIGIFFIAIFHSVKSLRNLTLRQGKTKAVFLGELAQFNLYVENQTMIPRYSLNFSSKNSQHSQVDVDAYSTKHVFLLSQTQQRGWHKLGEITLSCEFPLGLFRTWSLLNFDLKTLVYPAPATIETALPENTSFNSQTSFSKFKQGDEDFYSLKPYQIGDSIKKIHWKAYAKGLGLFSKQCSGNVSEEIWLDYDQTYAQNSEARLSQLCRWVLDAEKAGIHYGFKLAEFTLQPNNGELHAKKCLDALALF